MKRDLGIVSVLWLVLIGVGLVLAGFDVLPETHSDKGADVRHAWETLVLMAVPVMAFVIAVLTYSFLAYRRRGEPAEDGPPHTGRNWVPKVWFVLTGALSAVVIVYPGLVGIDAVMKKNDTTDIVVKLQATKWRWIVQYPDQNVTTLKELVLPVDKHVRFEIQASDVLHSVWVPAFLLKVDAVPGKTTYLEFKTTKTGSFEDNEAMRLQCAELCGRDHATMQLPVRVVAATEFDQWVADLGGEPGLKPSVAKSKPGGHSGH